MAPAHTRSACILPFVSALRRSGHTHGQQQNHFTLDDPKINTDIPRDAKVSVASTGFLPLCHQRSNTAQCTHLFSSCSVSRLLHTFFDGLTPTKARHKSHCDRTSSCDERLCVHGSAAHTCWHDRLQPVPSCQFIGSSMGKRKWPIPRVLIPTGSANTLVASRHSSAHPGILKSDVELSASNATIPAHMSAPPEKKHKLQTTPFTRFRASFRHTAIRQTEVFVTPMHLPTQSHSPCTTAAAHTRLNKCSSDQCYPRAAVGSKQKRRAAKPQKSATNGRKSTERCHSKQFSPHALNLPPSPTKAPRAANQARRPTNSLCKTRRNRSASCCHPGPLWTP
ncbi:hypothetical protein TcCL_Unassigned00406 [Trypanosoma cruzi]|nr:hypothetical protein TcCL_Unassigned00406 [Trypanosoma cruzi]